MNYTLCTDLSKAVLTPPLSLADSLIKHQVIWKSILSSPQVKSKAHVKTTVRTKLMLQIRLELYNALISLSFCFNASYSSVGFKSAVQSTVTFKSVIEVLFLKHAIYIKIPVGSITASPVLNQDSQTVPKWKVVIINIPCNTS